MYKYDNLLVCLDLSALDDQLIKYTAFFASTVGSKKVHFIHVMKYHKFPPEIAEKYPDFNESMENVIKDEMHEKIEKHFVNVGNIEKEVILEEGNATDRILKVSQQIDADLLLVGKKTGFEGEGILPAKLVRLAQCSVLFVPESSQRNLNKLLIPIDFSKPSQLAFEAGLNLAIDAQAEMFCQHVYEMPKQYFPHLPEKDWEKSLVKDAEKEYEKFLKKVNKSSTEIPCYYTFDDGKGEPQKIYDYAVTEECDMIVVGSKGHSAAASALIGSVSEKLSKFHKNIPLLIVKDKKESAGILKSLFKAFK